MTQSYCMWLPYTFGLVACERRRNRVLIFFASSLIIFAAFSRSLSFLNTILLQAKYTQKRQHLKTARLQLARFMQLPLENVIMHCHNWHTTVLSRPTIILYICTNVSLCLTCASMLSCNRASSYADPQQRRTSDTCSNGCAVYGK